MTVAPSRIALVSLPEELHKLHNALWEGWDVGRSGLWEGSVPIMIAPVVDWCVVSCRSSVISHQSSVISCQLSEGSGGLGVESLSSTCSVDTCIMCCCSYDHSETVTATATVTVSIT